MKLDHNKIPELMPIKYRDFFRNEIFIDIELKPMSDASKENIEILKKQITNQNYSQIGYDYYIYGKNGLYIRLHNEDKGINLTWEQIFHELELWNLEQIREGDIMNSEKEMKRELTSTLNKNFKKVRDSGLLEGSKAIAGVVLEKAQDQTKTPEEKIEDIISFCKKSLGLKINV